MVLSKRAFYALCTHIDHQIRLLIGTLTEADLLDNTIIMFTSDHGDMLFDHNLVAKQSFYENASNIPLIISGKPVEQYRGIVDDRLVCLADIMPTLLDLCDIEIPKTADGISAFSEEKRELLYTEVNEGEKATRMVHDGRHKLIYYPVGNYSQLFDLKVDPYEEKNLIEDSKYDNEIEKLTQFLISQFYHGDENWAEGNRLVGLPNQSFHSKADFTLYNQRGGHWPPPSGYKSGLSPV